MALACVWVRNSSKFSAYVWVIEDRACVSEKLLFLFTIDHVYIARIYTTSQFEHLSYTATHYLYYQLKQVELIDLIEIGTWIDQL